MKDSEEPPTNYPNVENRRNMYVEQPKDDIQ